MENERTTADAFDKFMVYVWGEAPLKVYEIFSDAVKTAEMFGGKINQTGFDAECQFSDGSKVVIEMIDGKGSCLHAKVEV